jgi:hypothetical protein
MPHSTACTSAGTAALLDTLHELKQQQEEQQQQPVIVKSEPRADHSGARLKVGDSVQILSPEMKAFAAGVIELVEDAASCAGGQVRIISKCRMMRVARSTCLPSWFLVSLLML